MALFKPNSTTDSCSSAVDAMRVSGGDMHRKRNRKIDLTHRNQMDQPQSFGDFAHGRLHRPNTKLTCSPFSYHYHRSKGTTSLQLETRSHRTRDPSFTRKLEEAQVVPLAFPHLLVLQLHPHLYVATERNDKPTVCSYRRQWNPCHMDFWSCLPASH